jgi:single-strand DNA-binding protein
VGFGERKTTQWVDCSIWGRRAEALAPHLTKGKQVVVSGEVTLREYEKRDGTRGAGLSVRVAEIDLVGGPREGESGGTGAGRSGGGGGTGGHGGGTPPRHDDLDDEIPFLRIEDGDANATRFNKHRPLF